jgi:hypothetical protein
VLKKIIPTCILVIVFLFPLPVYADKAINLVKNSGFEEHNGTNSTNWIVSGNDYHSCA